MSPPSDPVPDARSAGTGTDRRLRVLVVSPLSVWPPIHGGGVRITNLLRRLARRHDVSLLLVAGGTDAPEHRDALVPPFHELLVHPAGTAADLDPDERWPRLARPFASRALADRIHTLVHGRRFDVVQLEFTQLAGLVEAARPAKVILVEHDLTYRSHARQQAAGTDDGPTRDRDPADSLAHLERFELDGCRRADQVHVMSEHDRDELAARIGGDDAIAVVPNGVDTASMTPPESVAARDGFLLLGSFPHRPNLDAFDWTVSQVWPEIRRRAPGATLTVAGARPPARVLDMDGHEGIRIVGEVDDVRPLLRSHRLLLVPLRSGSGTRLKIVEAMACGLPVVSTTLGAEGLAVEDGTHLLLADDAAGLADAAARLIADDELAAALGEAGRRLVESAYDWDDVADRVHRLWTRLAGPPRSEPAVSGVRVGDTPTAAVVIPVVEDSERLAAACASIEAQIYDGPVDRILADARPSSGAPLARAGWRTVPAPSGGGTGPALDAAIRATAATTIALLSEDAVPADDRWLGLLLAPFASDRPPAAVQGGIWDQAVTGGLRVDPAWTAEMRRWRADHDGLAFDPACAAVRRDAWLRAPFGPWDRTAGLRWQRIAAECGWLILPCWDAAVVRVRSHPLRWWWSDALRTGRELRSMGLAYSAGDAAGDLLRPRTAPHRAGWLPILRGTLRRTPMLRMTCLRPLALLATGKGRRDPHPSL